MKASLMLLTFFVCASVFAQSTTGYEVSSRGLLQLGKDTTQTPKGFGEITVEEVMSRLAKGDSLVLLDVRTKEEYDGDLGHLPGSILIPVQEIEKRYHELDPLKNKEIIVYCRSGRRSERAGKFLAEKGFKVYSMLGGMLEWNKVKTKKTEK